MLTNKFFKALMRLLTHGAILGLITSSLVHATAASAGTTLTPSLLGSPLEGQSLSVDLGSWANGATPHYQWLRDNAYIEGQNEPTYQIVEEDVSHSIGLLLGLDWPSGTMTFVHPTRPVISIYSSRCNPLIAPGSGHVCELLWGTVRCIGDNYFGQLDDGTSLQTSSGSNVGIKTLTSTPTQTPTPTISGNFQVGSTLTMSTGVWDQKLTVTTQWLRDGIPISSATDNTYSIATEDADHQISVQTTGSATGYSTAVQTSIISTVGGKSFTDRPSPTPTVSGTFEVGSTLTLSPGDWGQGLALATQWLRDGMPITSATNNTYLIAPEDTGHQISAQTGVSSRSRAVTASDLEDVLSISSGESTSCAILQSLTVKCWGNNDTGQLGNGNREPQSGAVDVTGLTNVMQLASGQQNCALIIDGSVKCWGVTTVSDGGWTRTYSVVPRTVQNLQKVVSITGFSSHHCALIIDGSVKCWGNNMTKQLGDGTDLGSVNAVSVLLPAKAKRVSAGSNSTCAVMQDSKVMCWGLPLSSSTRGSYNNLIPNGQPTFLAEAVSPGNVPEYVSTAVEVSVGNSHACVLLQDLTVRCWGQNFAGELGDGTIGDATYREYLTRPLLPDPVKSIKIITGNATLAELSDGSQCLWGWDIRTPNWVYASTPQVLADFFDSATAAPEPYLTGSASDGKALQASLRQDVPGSVLSYLWLSDGVAIVGATSPSYQIRAKDINHAISVVVQAAVPGAKATSRESASTLVVGTLINTPQPTISGTFKVGSTLTVSTGTWDQNVTVSTQWLRDGIPISGSINNRYQLTAEDSGHQISVQTTGSATGYATAVQTSISSTVASLPASMKVVAPRVTGSAKIRQTLKATSIAWVKGASVAFQWLLDGRAITGATKSTYKLLRGQKGHKISVRVIQVAAGYITASSASTAKKVG